MALNSGLKVSMPRQPMPYPEGLWRCPSTRWGGRRRVTSDARSLLRPSWSLLAPLRGQGWCASEKGWCAFIFQLTPFPLENLINESKLRKLTQVYRFDLPRRIKISTQIPCFNACAIRNVLQCFTANTHPSLSVFCSREAWWRFDGQSIHIRSVSDKWKVTPLRLRRIFPLHDCQDWSLSTQA